MLDSARIVPTQNGLDGSGAPQGRLASPSQKGLAKSAQPLKSRCNGIGQMSVPLSG